MLHEALAWLAVAAVTVAPDAPSPDSSHDIVIAVIGVAGPLALGVVTLIFTAMNRRKPPDPQPAPAGPVPLNSDDEDEDDIELRVLRARNRALETFMWRHRMDPNRVGTGDEAMTDVLFE